MQGFFLNQSQNRFLRQPLAQISFGFDNALFSPCQPYIKGSLHKNARLINGFLWENKPLRPKPADDQRVREAQDAVHEDDTDPGHDGLKLISAPARLLIKNRLLDRPALFDL